MQAHGPACILEHSACILEHSACTLEHSACTLEHSITFCMHSGTFCSHSGTFCMHSGTILNILLLEFQLVHRHRQMDLLSCVFAAKNDCQLTFSGSWGARLPTHYVLSITPGSKGHIWRSTPQQSTQATMDTPSLTFSASLMVVHTFFKAEFNEKPFI